MCAFLHVPPEPDTSEEEKKKSPETSTETVDSKIASSGD